MCIDGDAFPGPSSDPAADGASLRHPGAQAGVIWGGARGRNRRGRRGRQLLGLWEWTRKWQHLLQLRGGGLYLPENASAPLLRYVSKKGIQQEKLCALKSRFSQKFSFGSVSSVSSHLLRQSTMTRWSKINKFEIYCYNFTSLSVFILTEKVQTRGEKNQQWCYAGLSWPYYVDTKVIFI